MKRREFIVAVGPVAAAWPSTARGQLPTPPTVNTVRQDWLNRRKESILEPEWPIVDPHHHLWIRPGSRYLFDDLLADMNSGHNIVATVYVQARSMSRETGPVEMRPVGETEFVNGIAAMFASGALGRTWACSGIVGQVDLRLGGRIEPVLTAHQRAGGDRFRGIRHRALAAHPNVYIKVAGLGMRYSGLSFNEQTEPPSSEAVAAACRPYVETCIEAFGASRSMFESNFPVDKVSYSYQVFWNACKLMAKGASSSEKADLFAGTAKRFYRLDEIR